MRIVYWVFYSIAFLFFTLAPVQAQEKPDAGALVIEHNGEKVYCPLQQTDIAVEVSGLVARVTVEQTFVNPLDTAIEAVYIFPLAHNAAVDRMALEVADRRTRGLILRRKDAKIVYDAALKAGHTAALLDQQRTNIFTQRVGNIPAHETVKIIISYIDAVQVAGAHYELHVPMVVAPRYIPKPMGEDAQEELVKGVIAVRQVKDEQQQEKERKQAENVERQFLGPVITPKILPPDATQRHHVGLNMALDFAMPLLNVRVPSHPCLIQKNDANEYAISLKDQQTIPNKDFVARWSISAQQTDASLMIHKPAADAAGYFMLQIMPSEIEESLREHQQEIQPRDFCFLIDVSGSMRGRPLAQVKECMQVFFKMMHTDDRLQLHTFAGSAGTMFDNYVVATVENKQRALQFTHGLKAGGGTEMVVGFQRALTAATDPLRKRYVILLSDGLIGNERDILKMLAQQTDAQRKFIGIGIGQSVNRALFDGIQEIGHGMAQVVAIDESADRMLRPLITRLYQPQLSNIKIDWGEMKVSDVFPSIIPDLYTGVPITLYGKFTGNGEQIITVRGKVEGAGDLAIPLRCTIPTQEKKHAAISTIWARRAVRDIHFQNYRSQMSQRDMQKSITDLALRYQIMSAYTSFVAVDEKVLRDAMGTLPQRLDVPVFIPEGMQYVRRERAISRSESGGAMAFMAIGAGGGASGTYGSRSGGGKHRAIGRHGGSKASEFGIRKAFDSLRSLQDVDGMWRNVTFAKKYPHAHIGSGMFDKKNDDLYRSAQIALVFLGAGYDHKTPSKYKINVADYMTSLLRQQQQQDGSFSSFLQVHSAVTQSMCEAYTMTMDPQLKKPAQKAIDYLLARQITHKEQLYAWGTGNVCSTEDTLQALMALLAAKAGGLDVAESLMGVDAWFLLSRQAGIKQGLNIFPDSIGITTLHAGTTDMSAHAFLTVMLLRKKRGDEKYGVDALAQRNTQKYMQNQAQQPCDVPTLHILAYAYFQYGGDEWKRWNGIFRDAIIDQQDTHGLWLSQDTGTSARSTALGDLYMASESVLTLEVYYRYNRFASAKRKK